MNATPRSPLRDLTSSTTLRDYQRDAVRNVLEALHEHRRVVLQMPTASGKTFTAMELLKALRQRGPVWFVCHRQEIINQTKEAMEEHEIEFGVISPRAEADPAQLVQVASVQSLRNRWQNYPAPAVIIWDECHHAVAKTWAEWFDRFPDAWHLGLTATPERLDGKPLSALFAHMVCGPSTRWLIDNGRLSPFRIITQTSEDRDNALRSLRASKGDYRPDDLDRIMNTPVLIGDALEHYQRLANGKRALAFCVNREASKSLVAKFTEAGIPAMHVDMETPDDARKAAVEALRSGDLKLISNVDVFTEGVDIPALDAVILMRPTRSLALYLQMVGRVLRRCEGKEKALVLDHAGFAHQHPLPADEYEWSLEGGARQRRVSQMVATGERTLICPQCGNTHSKSPTCDGCGFVYPHEKTEIAQFEGRLEEVASLPPPGCATRAEFARVNSVSLFCVRNWVSRGLPQEQGGYIRLETGRDWVAANTRRRPLPGTETMESFSKKIGASASAVGVWKNQGLPIDESGYVKTEDAMKWVAQHKSGTASLRGRRDGRSGTYTISAFARKLDVGVSTVQDWISKGLPITAERQIILGEGEAWVRDNDKPHNQRRKKNRAPMEGYEIGRDFAKRMGVTAGAVVAWKRRGIPISPSGQIAIAEGIRWVEANTRTAVPPSAWEGVEPTE